PKTSYSYRVLAYNSLGDSGYSNVSSATTLADTVAPTALLNAPNLTTGGGVAYVFTVTYMDNVAVDTSTIDKNDLLVTGPHGYRQRASLVSAAAGADGKSAVATDRVSAPKGTWDPKDNGNYKVSLQSNQIDDSSGNVVAAHVLGYFGVSISMLGSPVAGSADAIPDALEWAVDVETENDG